MQYVNKIPTYSFVWGFHDNGELITWHREYFVEESASQSLIEFTNVRPPITCLFPITERKVFTSTANSYS